MIKKLIAWSHRRQDALDEKVLRPVLEDKARAAGMDDERAVQYVAMGMYLAKGPARQMTCEPEDFVRPLAER